MNPGEPITFLICVTLFVAMMPIAPVSAAIEVTKIQRYNSGTEYWEDWADPVQKGDEIRVVGDGVTAGGTVNVYWDNAVKETFSSGSGKVASGTAKVDGSFCIQFSVPEGSAGTHYIWVKDATTGQVDLIAVAIIPILTRSPSTGLKGETVTLTGYGYGYDSDAEVGLEVFIDFSDFGVAVTPSPAVPQTDYLGTWSATFTVPDVVYGSYLIEATDEDGNHDEASFKVGASIALSISEGPVGSVITITGKGFSAGAEIWTDGVELDDVNCRVLNEPVVVGVNGLFTADIVVLSIPRGYYNVEVAETGGGGYSARAGFNVDGTASVRTTPQYGPQGSLLTVEGWNFSRIAFSDVKVSLDGVGSKNFKTDSTGHFKGSYIIPAVASGNHILRAEQPDYNISAESTVRVGMLLALLTPSSGPVGSKVYITGVGFTPFSEVSVAIGFKPWFNTYADEVGIISEVAYIPPLEAGTYNVTLIEMDTEIEVSASFTVTAPTFILVSPSPAPNGCNVTIIGCNFAADEDDSMDVPLHFVLSNETFTWFLDVRQGSPGVAAVVGDDGCFTSWWAVPDVDDLSPGCYMLNVTDGEGFWAATSSIIGEVLFYASDYLIFEPGYYIHYIANDNGTGMGGHLMDVTVENIVQNHETGPYLITSTRIGETEYYWCDSLFFWTNVTMEDPIHGGYREYIMSNGGSSGNQAGYLYFIRVPTTFMDGEDWSSYRHYNDDTISIAEYSSTYIGSRQYGNLSLSGVVRVDFTCNVTKDLTGYYANWYNGYGSYLLARNVGVAEFSFTNNNGTFTLRLSQTGYDSPKTISGTLTRDGVAPAVGHYVGLSHHGISGRSGHYYITDSQGKFNLTAYGQAIGRLVYGKLTVTGDLDFDKFHEMRIDDFTHSITGLNLTMGYPPESDAPQASISLQPETLTAPLLTEENHVLLSKVGLQVCNVTDLQSFTWSIEYDDAALEYWDVRLGPEVRAQTGGWYRSGSTGSLEKAFTGSGTLLEFYFKPLEVGITTVSLIDLRLYDGEERLIGLGNSSCTIKVILGGDWARENITRPRLHYGWNLVSTTSSAPENVLDFIAGLNVSVQYIYGYDAEQQSFVFWVSGLPPEYQTLHMIDPGVGYWLYARDDT